MPVLRWMVTRLDTTQRTVELLPRRAPSIPGVDDDRQRSGQALVAAARVDDHRQLAAVHPGIGPGGGPGLGPVVDAVAVGVGARCGRCRHPSGPRRPCLAMAVLQSIWRCRVVFHVVILGRRHRQTGRCCSTVEQGAVGGVRAGLPRRRGWSGAGPRRPVAGPDDVGVEAGDLGKGGVPAAEQPHLDVKQVGLARAVHVDGAPSFPGNPPSSSGHPASRRRALPAPWHPRRPPRCPRRRRRSMPRAGRRCGARPRS